MRLRTGYLMSGICMGAILLWSFVWSLPDGKLHVVFCSVGQGDGAYIRFPDGRDMVVDGGPDDAVLQCLGRHMPFWDHKITLVALSHPQNDHMHGLLKILERYTVEHFIRSDAANSTHGFNDLMQLVAEKHIPVTIAGQGDIVRVGQASLLFLWPSVSRINKSDDINDFSLVFELKYKQFDVVFPGDADAHVEPMYTGIQLADDSVEVLKVPHHGSKTGMTDAFIQWIKPRSAVISVGKNSYGHPSDKAINMLQRMNSAVYRTDISGDIEFVSDGSGWTVLTQK